jgi:hypothetical protein
VSEVDAPEFRETKFRETIREGLLVPDPDLKVWIENRSSGDTFTVSPENTVRDKEGRQ